MATTAHTNPPHLNNDKYSSFDVSKEGRNYGIILGVITAVYMIIINLFTGDGPGEAGNIPLGLRFAKHLLIFPVLWIAMSRYAKSLPDGRTFKNEISLLGRVAMWSALTIALANLLVFAFTGNSFEQFMQEGTTFMAVCINSGFLFFETIVFIMTVGFVFLQALKGGGSPED